MSGHHIWQGLLIQHKGGCIPTSLIWHNEVIKTVTLLCLFCEVQFDHEGFWSSCWATDNRGQLYFSLNIMKEASRVSLVSDRHPLRLYRFCLSFV